MMPLPRIALHLIHSIIPLALLRAMQDADQLPEIAGEPFGDLASVRLGGSNTIAAQIARYETAVRKHDRVAVGEVTGLLSLVTRRPDADLVLADAGRLAGALAAEGTAGAVSRLARGVLGTRGAWRTARKIGREVFDVVITDERHVAWEDRAQIGAGDLAGASCRMIGAAAAEVLHIFAGFEGALFHDRCRSTGAEQCAWSSNPPTGE